MDGIGLDYSGHFLGIMLHYSLYIYITICFLFHSTTSQNVIAKPELARIPLPIYTLLLYHHFHLPKPLPHPLPCLLSHPPNRPPTRNTSPRLA